MKRSLTIILLIALHATLVCAQSIMADKEYRRNSLATILVYHPEDEFGINIYHAFDSLPVPDKYDDHNISSCRMISNANINGLMRNKSGYFKAKYGHVLSAKEIEKNALKTLDILNNAQMAKHLVARWFNFTGNTVSNATFNTQLIQERGQYDASDVDVALAQQTTRNVAALSDAGEELLGHTFVLVNDITYVTAEEEAKAAKTAMNILGGVFDAVLGGNIGRNAAKLTATIADSFTGFNVKTHSYLYQLDWNDSIAAIFYQQYYTEQPDSAKIQAFLNDQNLFRLKYVAHQYEYDKKSTLKGKYERSELVKTICARSMDKNIVALGRKYEAFKVKTPIYSIQTDDNGRIHGYAAKIGLKEGVTEKTQFRVVQRIFDRETQTTHYKYVATVKPVKNLIWDNRYNAVVEQDKGSELPYTTFKKVSGGEILPGMLLIEGK